MVSVSTKNQNGVSIIAAVFIIVILAFMGVIFVSLIGTGSFTSVNDLQAAQALSVAEGGKEFILANRPFPDYSTAGASIPLGAGGFTVATPAITTGLTTTTATTINVDSTASFPASGRIAVDSEVIAYTAKTATQFNGTVTRGAGGTTAAQHASGNSVYPVTTVSSDPGGATIAVASTAGFSIPGVILIENENIYCGGATATTFTNCLRGWNGTTQVSHPAGRNVFQYMIVSTGTVGGAQRSVQAGIKQNAGAGAGIALDAVSTNTSNGKTINWNHTVSGSQGLLLVGISLNGANTVASVTYNNAALTQIGGQNSQDNASCRVEIWYLVAPALGTHKIAVTLSGSGRSVEGAVSFTGVDQLNPFDATAVFAQGTSLLGFLSWVTASITTNTDNAWVFEAVASNAQLNSSGVQVQQWNQQNTVWGAASTNGPISPAGAPTTMWWNGGNIQSALGVVALKPASSAGGAVSSISWQEVVN